jgi:hypothetical protein
LPRATPHILFSLAREERIRLAQQQKETLKRKREAIENAEELTIKEEEPFQKRHKPQKALSPEVDWGEEETGEASEDKTQIREIPDSDPDDEFYVPNPIHNEF